MKTGALIFSLLLLSTGLRAQSRITFENDEFRLIFNDKAQAVSLLHKASSEECLMRGVRVPAFTAMQYRPYDNENHLTFVTRPTTYKANSLRRDGDTLRIGFEHLEYIAVVSVKVTDHYIIFTPEYFIKNKQLGINLETRIDELTFLQLPVKNRGHFGEWLNVAWDDKVAVNLLGTDVHTMIDDIDEGGYHLMRAGSMKKVRLTGTGAALIVTNTGRLLDRIEEVENDFGLPHGVADRRHEFYPYSYYECRNVTPETVDEHIKYAKMGGFRMMVIYYPDFASSMGHFPWKESYPNGMKDLQFVTGKIKDAGMIPGFHIHYNKAQINDPYVTPVPDTRLNLRKIFTLRKAIDENSTIIEVEENPEGITLYEGRRMLKLGNEIIEYGGYTTQRPYRFTDCKRSALGTHAAPHGYGMKFGLLDVDNWPIFIRFDQRTSLQDEVADRLSYIIEEAGFRFVYFDGAEDVGRPYWFNVPYAQLRVYEKFVKKPYFSQGACKGHFSWHILSRGNAFDTFIPEEIKEAVNKRHVPSAAYNADNFTAIDFGWIAFTPPGDNTIGIQPDMVDYICAHAAGWDSPLSLVGKLDQLKAHPRTKDNMRLFRNWENAKLSDYFSAEQKAMLRTITKDHMLLVNKSGGYELYECAQIKNIAGNDSHVRAFVFKRHGKNWIRIWHTSGSATLKLNIQRSKIRMYTPAWEKDKIKTDGQGIALQVGDIRYLETELSTEEINEIFRNVTLR